MRDRLIKELDNADLFLRNRANSSPAPLNEYDIDVMLDIAKICDESARFLEKAIIPPCKVGDTVYKIRKFCETNVGYKEEYKPDKEFEENCPYLDPQSWYDDSDRCKAVNDYTEADYCTINLKILCDTCKSRLAIQKDKFTWSMMCNVFNTPMFNTNTDLYDTYFLTKEEAEQKLKECGG